MCPYSPDNTGRTRHLALSICLIWGAAGLAGCGELEAEGPFRESTRGLSSTLALQAKLNPPSSSLGGQEANDNLGWSVAISGDVAVAGAYGDDTWGDNGGAAYIYSRSGTLWSSQAKLTADDGAAGDQFGHAVSASGETVVVGAFKDDDRGGSSGSAYVFVRSGTLWSQQAKLTAADGSASDYFGYSLSINGDAVTVGAYQDDEKGSASGSAYVFSRSGTLWSQQAKLTAADGAANDHFGYSIWVWLNTVTVGAYKDDIGSCSSGSAYVFTRSGTSWSQQAKLTAADAAANDHFGQSVSVYLDTVAVGAPYDDDQGPSSGSAYVFARSGTVWSQQDKLKPAGGAGSDYFGYTVSVHDQSISVGAYQDDDAGIDAGSAHVFVRQGSAWSQQAQLTAADGAPKDYFGYSAALDSHTVVVGSPGHDQWADGAGAVYFYSRSGTTWGLPQKPQSLQLKPRSGQQAGVAVSISGDTSVVGASRGYGKKPLSGSAHVYLRSGSAWSFEKSLLAGDGARDDYFGSAVSVHGDVAAVGAYSDDDRGSNSGSAYVFMRAGSTSWSAQAKLTAWDGAAYDNFGWSVAVEGAVVAVGSPYDNDRGTDSGSAYVFARSGTSWSPQAKLTAVDGIAHDRLGWSISISNGEVVVGAPYDDDQGTNSGSAYVFARAGTLWSQQGKLTASDGAANDYFGWSVCVRKGIAAVGAHYDDDKGDASGSAYVFARTGTLWSQQGKLTAADGAGADSFGFSVAVEGGAVVVGAFNDDDRGENSGSAYSFLRAGTTWSQIQKLTASDGAPEDFFGRSVALAGTTVVAGAQQHSLESKKAGAAYVYEKSLSTPDAGVDAAVDAQPLPDQSAPDVLVVLDQSAPDLALPDQAAPDQSAPDQALPDQSVPDQSAPDQAAPDQGAMDGSALPDQQPALDGKSTDAQASADVSALPDLAPAQDLSTADGPAPGADQTPPPTEDCSCRIGGAPGRVPSPLLLLLGLSLLALVLRRP